MKTRIEVLTQKSVDEILCDRGYRFDADHRYIYDADGVRYKIAWIHSNAWGQASYIDLINI
jgi:hypothetical protein